jgi:hypothetical protein
MKATAGTLRKSRWGTAAGATVGAGALLFTVACGTTRELTSVSAQQLATGQSGVPVLVSCEPHQRTLVRQAVVNGAAVSQVECVAAGQVAAYTAGQTAAPAPVASAVEHTAPRVSRPVYSDIGDAQVVPAATYPAARTTARPVRTSQVVYDERPVRKTRSVKKSAVIIGSSAGVGAGGGAAMGGKKGALIGAAIGGGGAAIWDQITRK